MEEKYMMTPEDILWAIHTRRTQLLHEYHIFRLTRLKIKSFEPAPVPLSMFTEAEEQRLPAFGLVDGVDKGEVCLAEVSRVESYLLDRMLGIEEQRAALRLVWEAMNNPEKTVIITATIRRALQSVLFGRTVVGAKEIHYLEETLSRHRPPGPMGQRLTVYEIFEPWNYVDLEPSDQEREAGVARSVEISNIYSRESAASGAPDMERCPFEAFNVDRAMWVPATEEVYEAWVDLFGGGEE